MVYLRVLKQLMGGQLNLAHGTKKNKNMRKLKQKPGSSEETVRSIVHEGSPGRRSETAGRRICERSKF